jgi:predicted ATPase
LLPALGDRTINLLVTARKALRERAGDKRLVLFVDDAHLLDDASASLLLQLAANREVFVMATVRTGEDVSDAITELWKDGHAARLDVKPLPENDLDQLISESLGAGVENDYVMVRPLIAPQQPSAPTTATSRAGTSCGTHPPTSPR